MNVWTPDDRTLEVTLITTVSYWNELLAFPTFFPVRADVVAHEDWANDPETYVCNGAYTMTGWEHDKVITLEKNPNYADADQITMDTIDFYLSEDPEEALTRFESGDWQMIDMVNADGDLQAAHPDEYVVAGALGTYYAAWNANEDILPAGTTLTGADAEKARAEIRGAINGLFDRHYIVDEITRAGQVPASSLVAMGLTNPDGTQFYETAGRNEGFNGYYNVAKDAVESNVAEAVEVLKKYYHYDAASGTFTNVPTLTYLINRSPGHQAIGEYLQDALRNIGIRLELEDMEWQEYLNARKSGEFSLVRGGWMADYNDPITFLDMWVTGSGNNDAGFGSGDHATAAVYSLDLTDLGYDVNVENGTWAETFDVLIRTIKGCANEDVRYQLMHRAEDLLMSTGCICPLYYYTDVYLISRNVQGFFAAPTGTKFFMYCT